MTPSGGATAKTRRSTGPPSPLDGHGHGVGDLRKKNPSFYPLGLNACREPGEERAGGILVAEEVPPLQLERAQREEVPEHAKRRRTHPAKWQVTTNLAMVRHPLCASWLGATLKWESTSLNNGCSGTRIPTSSACA
jgi:hypothetical protein